MAAPAEIEKEQVEEDIPEDDFGSHQPDYKEESETKPDEGKTE